MPKKHKRQIPAHRLYEALDLLEFHVETDDPQQAFIDLLDNYAEPEELHAKTQLPMEACKRILNLRDIATALVCKTRN